MIRVTTDQTSYTAELSSFKSCLYKDALNKHIPIRVKKKFLCISKVET